LRALSLTVVSGRRGGLHGERRGLGRGTGTAFVDHRPYVPGDDVRQLDVGIYQRHRRLFVRQYEQTEDLNIYLVVDASASMACPSPLKFRTALRLAAALGHLGLLSLDSVTAVGVSGSDLRESPGIRGSKRVLVLLQFLESLRANGTTALGPAMQRFVRQGRRPGAVVLFTDAYDSEATLRALDVLRAARHEVTLVQLADDAYLETLPLGEVEFVDAETSERSIAYVTEAARAQFIQRQRAEREALVGLALQRGIPGHIVNCEAPLLRAVLQIVRRRGRSV
jgi:uncharacterized protein (DUF58 family)